LPFASFDSIDELYKALRNGAGAVVVTDEAVTDDAVRLLTRLLNRRPPWSNLPIIVLTKRQPQSIPGFGALDLFTSDTQANLTVLERPVHPVTLTTVLRSAIRARRRQYQVRDLLNGLQTKNAELEVSEEALQIANRTLEDRVSERTKQVRDLALAVNTAEQHERNRIASILHDHLQQIIHSAKMWAELSISEPDTRDEGLPRLASLLQEALDTTRSLTVELNPPILTTHGLVDTLSWLVDHVQERHGLTVHLDIAPEVQIENLDLRMLLFQLIRELLFNIVKHAGVTEATIRARISDIRRPSTPGIPVETPAVNLSDQTDDAQKQVIVTVADQGAGFDLDAVDGGGHGLLSVREQLRLVGGRCQIDTAPGEGTRITLSAPIEHDAAPSASDA
jgi:signal transduction histidine kinase